MERIQINGVWYIKETNSEFNDFISEFNEDQVLYNKSCLFETNEYLWEAKLMTHKNGKNLYPEGGLFIEFTDKNENYKHKELWDNTSWMLGVYHNEKDSLIDAADTMDEEGIETFKDFIGHLIELNWLKDE